MMQGLLSWHSRPSTPGPDAGASSYSESEDEPPPWLQSDGGGSPNCKQHVRDDDESAFVQSLQRQRRQRLGDDGLDDAAATEPPWVYASSDAEAAPRTPTHRGARAAAVTLTPPPWLREVPPLTALTPSRRNYTVESMRSSRCRSARDECDSPPPRAAEAELSKMQEEEEEETIVPEPAAPAATCDVCGDLYRGPVCRCSQLAMAHPVAKIMARIKLTELEASTGTRGKAAEAAQEPARRRRPRGRLTSAGSSRPSASLRGGGGADTDSDADEALEV